MVRNRIVPLGGVIVALGLAGCAASPLYVPSSSHRGTVGEIPRDGNGEPMWEVIPRPMVSPPAPYILPAPGIPITGPGVAEMRPPAASYAPPAQPVPITGPGVAEMQPQPAYAPPAAYTAPATVYRAPVAQAGAVAPAATAPQTLYAASPRSAYVLSPLAPDASPSEIRKRKRERRRECAHQRDCPPDIRP